MCESPSDIPGAVSESCAQDGHFCIVVSLVFLWGVKTQTDGRTLVSSHGRTAGRARAAQCCQRWTSRAGRATTLCATCPSTSRCCWRTWRTRTTASSRTRPPASTRSPRRPTTRWPCPPRRGPAATRCAPRQARVARPPDGRVRRAGARRRQGAPRDRPASPAHPMAVSAGPGPGGDKARPAASATDGTAAPRQQCCKAASGASARGREGSPATGFSVLSGHITL
jgi:hypothetical protein